MTIRQPTQSSADAQRVGQLAQEAAACRQMLAQNPNQPDVLHRLGVIQFHLGNLFHARGAIQQAVAAYQQALLVRPDWPEALQNLASSLHQQGRPDQAEASARRALVLRPDFPEAHNSLGAALAAQSRFDEAIREFQNSLRLKPNFPGALANLGGTLRICGQLAEAIPTLRRSIELDPNLFEAHNNLGIALKQAGQLEESIAALGRALALRPNAADAINNLGNVYKDAGQVQDAVACYGRSLALMPNAGFIHSNLIYTLQFHAGYDDAALFREQRRWNQLHAEPLKQFIRVHENDPSPDRRLRIGYVSPCFYSQAESFFLIPLLEAHDHERFEIYCYAHVNRPDDTTARMRRSADVWRDVLGRPDAEVVEQIRQDRIDVLVDLAMHMAFNRLPIFARKPAPVQAAWLAYPGGTGLDAMDYRITDPRIDPPGAETPFYREESIRLPDVWCCYDPLCDPIPTTRQSDGIFRFGSINNPCKMNEPLLRLWARVLQATPDSRLLIQAVSRGHREKLVLFFMGQNIAANRIEFVGRRSREDYLRLYNHIDICLDPLPYNGITTTCDALWMGVPVISLPGKTAAGRAGLSLLSSVGLPNLVAREAEDFVRLASGLAGDSARLAELRLTLREKMCQSPVMDAPRFARNMEAAYRGMWQRWCESKMS